MQVQLGTNINIHLLSADTTNLRLSKNKFVWD